MAQTKQLRELYAVRDSFYSQLNEIYAVAVSAKADPGFCLMFQIRHEQLRNIYDQIIKVHSDVVTRVANVTEPNLEIEHEFLRRVDQTYFAVETIFRELFPPAQLPIASQNTPVVLSTPPSTTRLPKRNLRTFDGKVEDWTSFIQVFAHSIHDNSSVANIEKFEYLLGCLSGEPLNLIKTIPLSDDNYIIAYKALCERYDNKRDLATYFWNRLHSLSKLKDESAAGLRNLCDNFKENLAALRALKIADSLEDFILLNLLLEKLDPNTRRLFEAEIRDLKGDIPSFNKLSDFVEGQCRVLASEQSHTTSRNSSKSNSFNARQKPVSSLVANSLPQTSSNNCYVCDQNHFVYACPLLQAKSSKDRYKLVKDKKLCVNCLRPHQSRNCQSKSTCRTCNKSHHSMLHFETSTTPSTSSVDNGSMEEGMTAPAVPTVNVSCVNALSTSVTHQVALLSTALVDIRDSQGRIHTFRAILDSGSEASFITMKSARMLNLRGNRDRIKIQGVGASSTLLSSESIHCQIGPRGSSQSVVSVDAHVIPQISSIVPPQSLQQKVWDHIVNLKLADPEFYISRHIDLLLGADVYAQVLRPGIIVAPNNCSPSALNTVFGWVLSGTVSVKQSHNPVINSFHTSIIETCLENDLDHTMKQFWQVEEVPAISTNSPDDDACEKLFAENVSRLPSGRFVVPLPFRESNPTFSESKDIAIRRFYAMERRLKKDPILQRMYVDFLRDYLETGHMEVATPIDTPNSYYIPHHCVLRPESLTTKLRVVFDASAKAANNKSLNDTLLVGSKLQHDIVDILLRFRLHSIAFIADIKQMYRQVQIAPEYWDYQRIIWRFNSSDPLTEYRLKTVTYGVASAPFLALRTMQQLALEGQTDFPLAAAVLQSDIYVDDIITGCDSLSQALKLQGELIQLLNSGGFPLRKWCSNHPAVLEMLPAEHCQSPFSFDADPLLTLKVLGLQWTPSTDVFTYHFVPLDRPCTKRGMLSELARVFDPIGFLTPITFYVKHLLQLLWRSGIGWDDCPPQQILNQWLQFKSQIQEISNITIDRRLMSNINASCQIHGFCDASMAGYAAAVYLRFDFNGICTIRLIMAKSKVAPPASNKLTIPRLELCGAVLLSKLLHLVENIYSSSLRITEVFAWTDSSIVLSWIRSPPHRWKMYVANRVAYIQERVAPSSWHHIQSSDNPADCASRGLLPSQLIHHPLWWSGPPWLSLQHSQWPLSDVDSSTVSESPCDEERVTQALVTHVNFSLLDELLTRFSSLRTIINVTAFIFRFAHNCKDVSNRNLDAIDALEAHNALLKLVKLVQAQVFAVEITRLQANQLCSKPLRKLNLFVDEHGILRVGGRLRHSKLPFEQKFPALLPSQHRLTSLIIDDTHKRNLHPGFKTLHYLLLQNFWILSPHRAIKNCLSRCHRCFHVNPRTLQPPMGDLPSFRFNQLKAFQVVGTDFGGPFTITMNRVRGAKTLKAYLCLFICLSTRAIHLEIVSDLSTDAFLAALRRFIARRGRCTEIHSDCGTNYVGASRQLLEFARSAAEIEQIRWKFNPPSAPHFGGIWEAGIKSVKTHLMRVIGDQILTFEELHTVFVQIEAVLNSRPLSPLSSDPNDLNVLTPGHFLTLAPLTSFLEPDLTDIKINRLKRWQLVQQMSQHFWKRWSSEFLHTLQQRNKWTNPSSPIEIGTLVLIKDELSPPLRWRLGRVLDMHPGADKTVRVVTLKTQQGTLKRPVVKLCPLPNSA